MIKTGFAKIDLESALRPIMPVREERVQAISMYFADTDSECVWTVLDFMDFDLNAVNILKNGISEATGIDTDHVHIVTTHNHGGGMPDLTVLAELAAKCALEAKACARNAVMRYVGTKCDKQVNYIRRKYIPELNGSTTIYYGPNADEAYNAAPFIENTVQSVIDGASRVSYTGRRITERPYEPFDEGDNEVFAAEFRGEDGTPIGSIVRFAAHAVCCNRPDSFSSDYPYHIRRTMEESLCGISLFFNGPCANISPGMCDKYDGTERRLGEYVAATALKALEHEQFRQVDAFTDKSISLPLKVRDCVKSRHIDLISPLPESLPERKAAMEHNNTASWMSFLWDKYTLGTDSRNGYIDVSLGLLKIGDMTIAAFPGETFYETGRALYDEFSDKAICTVTEHGRTAMYMPPSDECEKGGYETVCRTIECGEEAVLRSTMISEVKNILK